MRVISGKAKSLRLKTIEGETTRPTTDRIKETLFNIIGNEVYDARFLDLFAGSGAIGIEALSRGAACCDFVDNNPRCISVIKDNLKFTHLEDNAFVTKSDVISFINTNKHKEYDIIFIDPPYKGGFEESVFKAISESALCHRETLVVLESLKEFNEEDIVSFGFCVDKVKTYGSNKHIFLRRC